MVVAERFDPERHYELVCEWWTAWNWPILPLSSLPENGLIITVDGIPASVGWIYRTDSDLCWLEWITSNPALGKQARGEAVEALIDGMVYAAEALGFRVIFTSIRVRKLMRRLEARGFVISDNNATNLIRITQCL